MWWQSGYYANVLSINAHYEHIMVTMLIKMMMLCMEAWWCDANNYDHIMVIMNILSNNAQYGKIMVTMLIIIMMLCMQSWWCDANDYDHITAIMLTLFWQIVHIISRLW